MPAAAYRALYRYSGAGLLRAAALPVSFGPIEWPDLADAASCRAWLNQAWHLPGLGDAVSQAGTGLAERVDHIVGGGQCGDKQLRRAVTSVVRYLVRATGRPTPFGLFAGVTPALVGCATGVRWGEAHRAIVRPDTLWLSEIVDRLEADPDVLDQLNVVTNNLAVRRGSRWEVFHGPDRVSVRWTSACASIGDMAAAPIRFTALVDKLAAVHGAVDRAPVRAMLADLVKRGYLRTSLRPPMTVTDPLAYVADQLGHVRAQGIRAAGVVDDLDHVADRIRLHNAPSTSTLARAEIRTALGVEMAALGTQGRTPLAIDLLLDCDLQIPEHVVRDLERAASVLMRLQRPIDDAGWRGFHAAFVDRYGIGTLVPIRDVVDQGTGLGYPGGFTGSVLDVAQGGVHPRDERLLALAWHALAAGDDEIVLTEQQVDELTGDWFDERSTPPHMEIAARLHATSTEAVDRGNYLLTVGLARAAGTLTSRFTVSGVDGGLGHVYRGVPSTVEGALPVQLSFRPMFPHSENICRVPAYLPHVLALDDPSPAGADSIDIDDVAVLASQTRLHLASVSRRQVIEPQVFHALAVEKQAPPLARFLAHLDRAYAPVCREFDWGPHAGGMPYLPRVRYGRTILAPARWRLIAADLPDPDDRDRWLAALADWRRIWRCPDIVELRDDDRTLRLNLTIPAHLDLLRAHLAKEPDATVTEAATSEDLAWLGGHAHEIALTLTTTRPPALPVSVAAMPIVTNRAHGSTPGTDQASWLYAKIFTHPDLMDEIIATRLPVLVRALDGDPPYWFVRYRSPQETDHLRLRIRVTDARDYGTCAKAIGDWMNLLRDHGLADRLVFDTYYPEVGRYGAGAASCACATVFAADSRTVAAALRSRPSLAVDMTTFTVLNMIDIAEQFLGGRATAMRWLRDRTLPPGRAVDRAIADGLVRQAVSGPLPDLQVWPSELIEAWQDRRTALAAYRHLCESVGSDAVLTSLLHMHHNRAHGIQPDHEAGCLRLARRAALAWLAIDARQARQ